MSYELKYYFIDKKIVGPTTTTYRFEILEDGYSGSSTEWRGVQINRQYEENNFRQLVNIQKGSCSGIVRVESSSQRDDLIEIAGSENGDYKVQLKKDGTVIWTGLVVPDLTVIGEQNYGNQTATIMAKDVFLSGDYPLTTIIPDTRGTEKAIVLIADILDTLGYGIDIVSYTSWTEDSVTEIDDILNQSYHEKERLRVYSRTENGTPKALTNEQALLYILKAYSLILRQVNGKWNLIQISAFETPSAVRRYVYNSSGSQTSDEIDFQLGSVNTSNDLYVLGATTNNYFAGVKKVKAKFQHDSLIQGIKLRREYWITDNPPSEIAESQFWQADGTGNIELYFVTWLAKTTDTNLGNPVVASVSIYVDTGTDDYYWDGTDWVTTPTTIEVELPEQYSTTDSDGNYLYKNNGLSIVTDPIPDAADGTLNIKITPDAAQPNVAYFYFRSVDLQIQYSDDSEGTTTNIDYELVQTKDYNAEYDYGTYYYGDGPTSSSLSALKDSNSDLLTLWKRYGDDSTITHQQLLLNETLNVRRNQRRNLKATLYGEYEPDVLLVYDATNFFFMGGSWDSKSYQWITNFIELTVEEGTDTLNTFYESDGAGSSGAVGSLGTTVGAGSQYLEKARNLNDLPTPSTARNNLGLGTSDNVEFSTLDVGDPASTRNNLDLGTGDAVTFSTVNTGQGDNELYAMNQPVRSTDAVTFATVDTGQGANELYAMDQDVQQADSPTFSRVVLSNQADDATKALRADREVNTGDGLTGGGDLTTDQTLTLGTPGTTEVGGSNAVTSDSHTHALDLSGRTLTIANDTNGVLTFDSNAQNLGADRTWTPTVALHDSEQDGALQATDSTVYGAKTFDGNVFLNTKVESLETYNAGIFGTGTIYTTNQFPIDDNNISFLEVDNMRVRNEMRVHIFKKDIVKASNAYLFITDSAEIAEFSDIQTTADTFKVLDDTDNTNATFEHLDLLWAKNVEDDGSLQVDGVKIQVSVQPKFVWDNSTQVWDADPSLDFTGYGDGFATGTISGGIYDGKSYKEYNIYEVTEAGELNAGDTIVRVNGGSILNDASSDDSPFIDIYDGVETWADFQSVNKSKVRLGNLSAVPNASGYGLHTQNAFLTGDLVVGDLTKVGNYLEYSGGNLTGVFNDIDFDSNTFSLETTNLRINSQDEIIQIGSVGEGNWVELGDLGSTEYGLSLNANNYWKYNGLTGAYFFKVGGASNFISFNTASGTLDIETDEFSLTAGEMSIDSNNGVVIDGTNFFKQDKTFSFGGGLLSGTGTTLSISGSGASIDVNSFELTTDDIRIDSSFERANSNITSSVTYGDTLEFSGIFFDSDNYLGHITDIDDSGNDGYLFRVGGTTSNFLEVNEAGSIAKINFNTFTLDATDASGGIKIDSANELIQLEDANEVRTQIDITSGSPTISESLEDTISAKTFNEVASPTSYETTTGTYYNIDKGNAVEVFVTATCNSITNATGASFLIELYGGNSTTSATNLLVKKRSQIITASQSTSLYVTAYSYTYDYYKIILTCSVDIPSAVSDCQFKTSTFTVKQFNSQTRISLDGVYVNNDSQQYARLTRDSNTLSGLTILENLPTGDPDIAGAIYNDNGTLKIS